MQKIIHSLIILLLFSCKSIEKITVKECNERIKLSLLAAYPKSDTIFSFKDTLIKIQAAKSDTIERIIKSTDTMIKVIYKDKILYKLQKINDTIKIKVDCPDTNYKFSMPQTTINHVVREVPLAKLDSEKTFLTSEFVFWILCIISFLLGFGLTYFTNQRKA